MGVVGALPRGGRWPRVVESERRGSKTGRGGLEGVRRRRNAGRAGRRVQHRLLEGSCSCIDQRLSCAPPPPSPRHPCARTLLQFVLLASLPLTPVHPFRHPFRSLASSPSESLTPLVARTSRNHRIDHAVVTGRCCAMNVTLKTPRRVHTPPNGGATRHRGRGGRETHVWTWTPLMNRDYAFKKLRELRPSLKTQGSLNPACEPANVFRPPDARDADGCQREPSRWSIRSLSFLGIFGEGGENDWGLKVFCFGDAVDIAVLWMDLLGVPLGKIMKWVKTVTLRYKLGAYSSFLRIT